MSVSPCLLMCGQPACQKLGCVRAYNADAPDDQWQAAKDTVTAERWATDTPREIPDGCRCGKRLNSADCTYPDCPGEPPADARDSLIREALKECHHHFGLEEDLDGHSPGSCARCAADAALDSLTGDLAKHTRKVEAYDAARVVVKKEGNSRAYYVLRAEKAERERDELGRELMEMQNDRATWEAKARDLERELADAKEAMRLALNGIPDPMHPHIPPKFVDGLVCAQIILNDALGDDDPGDVPAARAALSRVGSK